MNIYTLHYKEYLVSSVRKIIDEYFQNHTRRVNTLCRQNATLLYLSKWHIFLLCFQRLKEACGSASDEQYKLVCFIFTDVLSFWATFGRKNVRGCSGYFGFRQGD
jgi:hypothetical protein